MKELSPSIPYPSSTARLRTGCGSLYLTIVKHDNSGDPIKVFLQLGKAGGCAKAHLSILSEHINVALENGIGNAITYLSRCTGITCPESDSCIPATVRYVLNELIRIKEIDQDDGD